MKNRGIAPQNKHLAFKSIHLRNEIFISLSIALFHYQFIRNETEQLI